MTEPADFRFDVERLLAPISASQPSGESLRHEGTYDRIKQLRQEDDPNLPQGVWQAEVRRAHWPSVEQECIAALETRSKDLNLAVWLTEAWVRLHGFAGLREGLIVLRELVDNFWESIHPEARDGDVGFRIAPLEWVNDKLSVQLKLLPLSNPDNGSPRYGLADWETALLPVPKAPRGQPAPALHVTQALFAQSMTLTPTRDLYLLGQQVREAMDAAQELAQALDAVAGGEATSLAALRGTLASILTLLASYLNDRADLPRPELDASEPWEAGATELPLLPTGGRIRTRAEAYQRLAEAADFLLRTEPHSPVPYLVKRAIGWGSLSLSELLPELIRNSGELSEIVRLLRLNGGDGEAEQ